MITEEDFARVFAGCEVGNSNSSLFILRDKIEKGAKTFQGELITLELIRDKYDEYCQYWKNKYAKSDPKYISSKDKKVTVYDFLMQAMYNNSYEREELPRDYYLFGNTNKQELVVKIKIFIANARRKNNKTT
jgi:hypothetical protein